MIAAVVRPRAKAKPSAAKSTTAQPTSSPSEADFLRGRDIAVMMLREGYGFRDSDETAGKRWYRGGKPQERFVKGYLQGILKEPALLDGFAAVLSAAIGEDCFDDFESYGTLPMAEFQAGDIGADGTCVDDSASPPAAIASAGEASFFSTVALQQICARVNQAVAIIDVYADHFFIAGSASNAVCWGASRLLDTAAVIIAKTITSKSNEDAAEGSTILTEALAVMKMFAAADGGAPLMTGAITLAQLAKDELDGLLPATS